MVWTFFFLHAELCRMISNKTCAVSNNTIDFIRNDKYDLYHSLI